MKYIVPFKLFESRVKSDDKIDIYRDDNYIVVSPLTHKASCKYGAFTKWCISTPSDSVAFDSNPDAIIVFIIQRNYKISDEKEEIIQRFLYLHEKIEQGDVTEEEEEEYLNIMSSDEAEDLSKIALVKGKKGVEIWDKNNICLDDNYLYGYLSLPIDKDVLYKIEEFFDSYKK